MSTPDLAAGAAPPQESLALPSPSADTSSLLVRFSIAAFSGAFILLVDSLTKASSHPLILHHYRHLTVVEFASIGFFLFFLGLYRSNLLALAAGCFIGTLLGNGGELLLHGYATDWIQLDLGDSQHIWLTNVADIAAAVGLVCLVGDFALAWRQRKTTRARPTRRVINVTTVLSATLGLAGGLITQNVDAGLILFMCALAEGQIITALRRRQLARVLGQ